MAIGNYGIKRGADVSPQDMEIYYTFSSSSQEDSTDVFTLNPTDIISQFNKPVDEQVTGEENILEGLYNLTFPANIFNQVGIYTIFIRPKQVRLTIQDCGVLSAQPTVKGIIVDGNTLSSTLAAENGLVGYRIEYINSDGTKRRNVVRYITSSNRVVPVSENVGDTSQSAVRYRYDSSGNLIFLTLTPSSANSVKPNVRPFIGIPSQSILVSNTFFDPVTIELNLVENDIDTVVQYVGGNVLHDVQNGIITYYSGNDTNEILKQFNSYTIETESGSQTLYEVKEERTTIDDSQDIDQIKEDNQIQL